MNCPECEGKLTATLNEYQQDDNFTDVDFECEKGHTYFARIRADDLTDLQ